jgi:hypothetical protein
MAHAHSPDSGTEHDHEVNGHRLTAVVEYIPGAEPTDYDIALSDGPGYETRFYRCLDCGQERNRRDAFTEACSVEATSTPLADGGHDLSDGRTRRAVFEDMHVRFGQQGPEYTVESESGRTYQVNIQNGTCTCPDHERRGVECKHLRRVDLDVRAGRVPEPDGTFLKIPARSQ